MSACPLPAGMHYFCLKTREVVSSGFPRPPAFQEVMSGSRLTPWTEDSPCLRCPGLALMTWKCGESSGGRKFWLHVPTVMLQVYLLAMGTVDFASRQMRPGRRVGLHSWRERSRQLRRATWIWCESSLSFVWAIKHFVTEMHFCLFTYLFRTIYRNVCCFLFLLPEAIT
jgi:hypothetical protein